MMDLSTQTFETQYIKSKRRVVDHGEVFTAQPEVSAMLDLAKQETERIDSRFLEPACGIGNFLAEILKRKLAVVKKRYAKSQIDFERYSIIALGSIYGVEILYDNVLTCRERLLGIYTEYYVQTFKRDYKPQCLESAEFILCRNILWGDALTLCTPDDNRLPIVFSEWSAVNGSMIKRRDYTMANLLANDTGENLLSDLGEKAFIPKAVNDFPLVHYSKLKDHAANSL